MSKGLATPEAGKCRAHARVMGAMVAPPLVGEQASYLTGGTDRLPPKPAIEPRACLSPGVFFLRTTLGIVALGMP